MKKSRKTDRWKNLTPERVAQAMFALHSEIESWATSWRQKQWGKLSMDLFREDSEQNRFWLEAVFRDDRKKVQTLYRQLASKPATKMQPVAHSTPLRQVARWCFCKRREADNDPSMIFCDQCHTWLHGICIGEQIGDVRYQKRYRCPCCKSSRLRSSDIVPKLVTSYDSKSFVMIDGTVISEVEGYGDITGKDTMVSADFDAQTKSKFQPTKDGSITSAQLNDPLELNDSKPTASPNGKTTGNDLNKSPDYHQISENTSANKDEDTSTASVFDNLSRLSPNMNLGKEMSRQSSSDDVTSQGFQTKVSPDRSQKTTVSISSPYQSAQKIFTDSSSKTAAELTNQKCKNEKTSQLAYKPNTSPNEQDMSSSPRSINMVRDDHKRDVYDQTYNIEGSNSAPDKEEAADSTKTDSDDHDTGNLTSDDDWRFFGVEDDERATVRRNRKFNDENDYIVKEVPKNFTFRINYNDWQKLPHRMQAKTKTKLGIGWSELVRAGIKKFNKYCPVSFDSHRALGKTYYFRAWGKCKFTDCMRFEVTAPNVPSVTNGLIVNVSCTDDHIRHSAAEWRRNQVKWDNRKKMKETLKFAKPGELFRKLRDEADTSPRRAGNKTNLPNKETLRRMRSELLEENDLAKDPLDDIRLRIEQDVKQNIVNIRFYSIRPFVLAFYTESQIQIFRTLRSYGHQTVLHIDATGNFFRKLPSPWVDDKLLLYVIAIQNPSKGYSPMTVAEAVLGNHDSFTIQTAFQSFFTELKKRYSQYPFTRIEADFSKAVLNAMMMGTIRMDLATYLCYSWAVLCGRRKAEAINIHVCSIHCQKFFLDNVRSKFPKASIDEVLPVLRSWLHGFLAMHQLSSFHFRVSSLLRLCCNKFKGDDFERLKEIATGRTPHATINAELWLSYDTITCDGSTIHKNTPFGAYCYDLYNEFLTENEDLQHDNGEVNPFHSADFLKYCLKSFFPYTPILSHLMFPVTNDAGSCDHNNPVEYIFNLKKNVEERQFLPDKISRYPWRSCVGTEGSALVFEEGLQLAYKHIKQTQVPKAREKVPFSSGKKFPPPKVEAYIEIDQINIVPEKAAKPNKKSRTSTFEEKTFEFRETWSKKMPAPPRGTPTPRLFHELCLIPWGNTREPSGQYMFTNTCPFDAVFQLLLFADLKYPAVTSFFLQEGGVERTLAVFEGVKDVLDLLKSSKYNQARTIWETVIRGCILIPYPIVNDMTTSAGGVLSSMEDIFQNFEMIVECPIHGILKRILFDPANTWAELPTIIPSYFADFRDSLRSQTISCDSIAENAIPCNQNLASWFQHNNVSKNPMLFIKISPKSSGNLKLSDIPTSFSLGKNSEQGFDLVGLVAFLAESSHFICLLFHERDWWTIDSIDVGQGKSIQRGAKDFTRVQDLIYVRRG